MKIIPADHQSRTKAIGEMAPGDTFMNGEDHLCMKANDAGLVGFGKCRVILLSNGGMYTVQYSCHYRPVDAVVSWVWPK